MLTSQHKATEALEYTVEFGRRLVSTGIVEWPGLDTYIEDSNRYAWLLKSLWRNGTQVNFGRTMWV